MTLAELIRLGVKGDAGNLATATPATAASRQRQTSLPVARVATVAVAPYSSDETANCRHWRIQPKHGAPFDVIYGEAVTLGHVRADYPNGTVEAPNAPSRRIATPGEVAELRVLVAAIIDNNGEQQEALAAALADPKAAIDCYRAIFAERHKNNALTFESNA